MDMLITQVDTCQYIISFCNPMPPKTVKRTQKKQDTGPRNIISRSSTLRWEIAKAITPPPRPISIIEQRLRKSLLKFNGLCEYCETRPASKGFGDHFHALIKDKYPSTFCNDEWNQMPCCSTCNSSKNGRHWMVWLTSNSAGNPLLKSDEDVKTERLHKFQKYDIEMQKYCQKKLVDKEFFDQQMLLVDAFLINIQKNVHEHVQTKILASLTDMVADLSLGAIVV